MVSFKVSSRSLEFESAPTNPSEHPAELIAKSNAVGTRKASTGNALSRLKLIAWTFAQAFLRSRNRAAPWFTFPTNVICEDLGTGVYKVSQSYSPLVCFSD